MTNSADGRVSSIISYLRRRRPYVNGRIVFLLLCARALVRCTNVRYSDDEKTLPIGRLSGRRFWSYAVHAFVPSVRYPSFRPTMFATVVSTGAARRPGIKTFAENGSRGRALRRHRARSATGALIFAASVSYGVSLALTLSACLPCCASVTRMCTFLRARWFFGRREKKSHVFLIHICVYL